MVEALEENHLLTQRVSVCWKDWMAFYTPISVQENLHQSNAPSQFPLTFCECLSSSDLLLEGIVQNVQTVGKGGTV